jgi:hypothetical protein
MITENLSTLKIHKLTQAQYERELAAGNIDENALYLTPDEAVDMSQYVTQEQLESKAEESEVKTATLLATNWTGSSAPYTQTVAITGITASSNGLVSLSQNTSLEEREAARNAMLSILNQDNNSVTIVADGDKPSIDIPITVVIVH